MAAPTRDEEKMYETDYFHPSLGFTQNVPNQKINWYQLMDQMIGSNRKRYTDVLVPSVGIQQPLSSPEEVRVHRVFESCAFKTGMSCAIGLSTSLNRET